jgi:ankyrin repeat protein
VRRRRFPGRVALVAAALAVLAAAGQRSAVTDDRIDALLAADDYARLEAAVGGEPDWTARIVSVFEDQGDLLTMAALRGARKTVASLLAAGANVDGEPAIHNGRNVWGYTPLYVAAREGHAEVARLLVDAGADRTRADHAGFQPLHAAAAFGRVDAVKVLLDAGVPVDARAERGDTAARLAAARRQDQTLALLLSRGADPDAADQRGDTPLHEAVRNGTAGAVRTLLDRGAHLRANRYGRTPLDEARDWAPELTLLLPASEDRGAGSVKAGRGR